MTKAEKNISAIFFDLDGTLADTAPDLAGALNKLRAEHGLPPLPLPELRPHVSAGAKGLLLAGMNIGLENPAYLAMQRQFLALYEKNVHNETRLFDGIAECLDRLDTLNIPWGIVTNKALRFAAPLIDGLGLQHRAICLVAGDSASHPKPHPAPLLMAARMAAIQPEYCIYIGDDERDILAAHAANMQAAAAAWGYLGSDKPVADWGADIIITSPKDIFRIITPSR
ncbi:MAG TPA: HAD-IA family hydrolase [Rugosibacter sp.]